MAGSTRERLRHIALASEHGTRAPEDLHIELLQLIAGLLIEIREELREPEPDAGEPAPMTDRRSMAAAPAVRFGL